METGPRAAENRRPMTIRLMLADDHRMLREGLSRSMREEGFDVVAEARNGAEAVQLATQVKPEVILMDVTMPELDEVRSFVLTILQADTFGVSIGRVLRCLLYTSDAADD